jgi:hypothetical protein
MCYRIILTAVKTFQIGKIKTIFFPPNRPVRLQGPHNLPLDAQRWQSSRGVKLTAHFQLARECRMSGAFNPRQHTVVGRAQG